MTSAIPITEHPDFAAITSSKSYPLPFWSGLFEKKHYDAMGGGPVFLFGYLVDRTTKEDSTTAAAKVGIVLGGKPIKDSVIGRHFGITTKTVARFRDLLIAGRYIECRRTPVGYRYTVLKSKKFGIWGSKRSDRTVQSGGKEIGQKCLISTPEIRQNCPVGSDKTVRNKEDHAVRPCSKTKPTPCANPQTGLHESAVPPSHLEAVKRVFGYYLEKLGKNPKLYEFTPLRKQKGLARLGEALRKTEGDLAKAEELMRIAVDNLAASSFHRGDNDRKKAYDSWEKHLFPSLEKFEWWLEQ